MNRETFHTSRYQLDIEYDSIIRKISLVDTYSGVVFADSQYRYSAIIEHHGNIIKKEDLIAPKISEHMSDRGGRIVTIEGTLGNPSTDDSIMVEHRIFVPEDEEYLEERIVLHNTSPTDIKLLSYRFGFRKLLKQPKKYGGPGIDIENYRLVAIPFRLQPDGQKHDYQLDDIYYGRYQNCGSKTPLAERQEAVDLHRARSEAWAWTDGDNGLILIKHNPNMIEFSMLETEMLDGETYLNFGGAAPCVYGEPADIRTLEAGDELAFGKTKCHFYEGLWRRGYYIFKDYMSTLGHGLPDNYDPPIYWKVSQDETHTPESIEQQADYAKEIGCEALYLGSIWEDCKGNSIWDEERLGKPEDIIQTIRDKFGLKVGIGICGRAYCESYRGMYVKSLDGSTGYFYPYHHNPYYLPCCSNKRFQQEKTKRILKIAEAGLDFIKYYEFDWQRQCFDLNHGHQVPTTPGLHAEAALDFTRKFKEKHPNVLVGAEDPVWPSGVRYLPVYYQHETDGSFDELSAFDLTDNPLDYLLSGRALSLFYYKLAYDLPLAASINIKTDNDNCLAFWWFASTVRHLGIGGAVPGQRLYHAYKKQLEEYKKLKHLYTHGNFFGIDELTHIHAIPEEDICAVNAFNLTDTPIERNVEISLNELGFSGKPVVDGATFKMIKNRIILHFEIPPFSPLLIKIRFFPE